MNTFFNQQYVLSDKQIPLFEQWPLKSIGNYYLYSHPDLETASKVEKEFTLTLLGYCYDYRYPERSNADIVQSFNIACSMNELADQLQFLSGIYLIIWQKPDDIVIIPDMCALREIYIDRSRDTVVVGSSPNILGCIRDVRSVQNVPFHNSNAFHARRIWPGNKTSFENITRLKPNHYLSLASGSVVRFFPCEELRPGALEDVVGDVSIMLPGILKAVLNRKKHVMMGLTSGWDSRVLLAASQGLSSSFLYFVNRYEGKNMSDQIVPMRLSHKLNLLFVTIQLSSPQGKPTNDVTPYIPDVLVTNYKKVERFSQLFPGYMSIAGSLSEIARQEYARIRTITGRKLAALNKFANDDYCISVYDEWLATNAEIFRKNKYDILDMFYWEEAAANRVGKSTTEVHTTEFSIFPIFNCRKLIQTLLSVDEQYREKQNNILYRKIVERLWPAALTEPINPSLRKRIIRTLQWLRVYNIYRSFFTIGIMRQRR